MLNKLNQISNFENKEKRRDRKRWIRQFNFYFSVIFLIVLSYFLFFASLSPVNYACWVCHSGEYQSFRTSPHKNLQCATCHSGGNLFSKLEFRFLLTGMPAYFFFDGAKKSAVSNETCLYCHITVLTKTTDGKSGVKMSHREPVLENYRCSDCHLINAHEKNGMVKGFPDMIVCFECHNGIKAKKECNVCHVKNNYNVVFKKYATTYSQIHEKLANHGKNPSRVCLNCHDMSYCATCHVMVGKYRVALPHPQDWIGLHPYSTNRDNVRACYACHEKKFCLDCHGVEMPHPENYLKVHTKEATLPEKCYKCHTKQSCNYCHENHRHPGIPQDLLKALRRLAGFE